MKNKTYLYLYYICFLLTLIVMIVSSALVIPAFSLSLGEAKQFSVLDIFSNLMDYLGMNQGLLITSIISFIIFIIFTILIIKKRKLKVNSLILPISYIVFSIIIGIICILFNHKVIVPYIHFIYYHVFMLISYLFLNIYSILCLTKND